VDGQEKAFSARPESRSTSVDRWRADTEQAVITGSFDVGIAVGILGVIGAWSKRAPCHDQRPDDRLARPLLVRARRDRARGFKDLAGKTVGFSLGSSSNLIAARSPRRPRRGQLISTGGRPRPHPGNVRQVDAGWSALRST